MQLLESSDPTGLVLLGTAPERPGQTAPDDLTEEASVTSTLQPRLHREGSVSWLLSARSLSDICYVRLSP
jgi:hypothetical protein